MTSLWDMVFTNETKPRGEENLTKKFDVLCVGNAIVDVVLPVSESFLEENQLIKGSMQLLSHEALEHISDSFLAGKQSSGGSAANTASGLAHLGARVSFIGKTADDALGKQFCADLEQDGVYYQKDSYEDDTLALSTARCLIAVTPDAQRTMQTYLGISSYLSSENIPLDLVSSASVLYCEGYLWDQPVAKEAILTAMRESKEHGGKVAFTLSDGFCVDRHRQDFISLLTNHVDIVFANETELLSLFETDDFDDACMKLSELCALACVTRSEEGSVVVTKASCYPIAATPVDQVIDTTGAGDLYAAGFLYGLTQRYSAPACGELASAAASHIIVRTGARPESDLGEIKNDITLFPNE